MLFEKTMHASDLINIQAYIQALSYSVLHCVTDSVFKSTGSTWPTSLNITVPSELSIFFSLLLSEAIATWAVLSLCITIAGRYEDVACLVNGPTVYTPA